jgi:hypothetical protein
LAGLVCPQGFVFVFIFLVGGGSAFYVRRIMPITITIYDDELAAQIKKSAPACVSIAESRRKVRTAEFDHLIIHTLTLIKETAWETEVALFGAWLFKISEDKRCHVTKGRENIPDTEVAVRRWVQEELDIGRND